jgi:glycosyltransferase involved in cell wall biosynthesis
MTWQPSARSNGSPAERAALDAGGDESRERIRIAHVITRMNVGGIAPTLSLLVSRLPAEGYDVRLFIGSVSAGEREMSSVLDQSGFSPVRIPKLQRAVGARNDATAFWNLAKQFREFRPHIVHTHTAKAGALGRVAARVCGVRRTVHTYHGHVFEGYFSAFASRSVVFAERALGRITDAVVTISPQQLGEITREYRVVPSSRARIIAYGFDLSRFRDIDRHRGQLRRELSIDSLAPVIACVGRLTAIKDHPLLFQAFSLLKHPTARLVVVGDGEERSSLERLARELGIAQRVHFLGFRDDLESILADTDVVVLTSRNEGTPVALIEGLAAGCFPLAISVGGVADVLADGQGRVVHSRHPKDFGAALDQVLADLEATGAARDARRFYAYEKYDAARFVADHVTLYRELLEAPA